MAFKGNPVSGGYIKMVYGASVAPILAATVLMLVMIAS
jgi:hypothetical protein